MPIFDRAVVHHFAGEYVCGTVYSKGIESFWSMLNRGNQGTFHHFSEKRLDRYATKIAGRYNTRDADTIDMMRGVIAGMAGKRLRYDDLIDTNRLAPGTRGLRIAIPKT